MSFFIIVKIIHIITAIFFIGVVGFRTFIFPVLKKYLDKHTYLSCDKAVGLRARGIIKINNIFLILSGLYLLTFYIEDINPLLLTKVVIGFILAVSFYIVPLIMKKMQSKKWFSTAFHHTFFFLLLSTVVLSQLIGLY